METLLLQSKNKKDITLFRSLAKKMGLQSHKVSLQEMEDIALAYAMKKGRTGKFINTVAFVQKLKGQ
jgi:hypothetical protein